ALYGVTLYTADVRRGREPSRQAAGTMELGEKTMTTEQAIDIVNRTSDEKIHLLDDNDDVVDALGLGSGWFRYRHQTARETRAALRQHLLDTARMQNYDANPDPEGSRLYWERMA